jgi:DNA repair ATPase RecN
MLEDQNDTIKHLKTNLENKIRESQESASRSMVKTDELAHKLADAKEDVLNLSRELDGQRNSLAAQLEDEYRRERSDLRREIGDLERKLQDRNGILVSFDLTG